MQLKTIKIAELKPHKSNPNRHPQEQLQELQSSLDQFDQVKNIVVWQGQVIAGCGLLEAAKKQGRTDIEVQDVSDWPEEKAIKFMIADNRLAEIAIMDDEALAKLLRGFDDPLDVPGIDESFLDELGLNDGEDEEDQSYTANGFAVHNCQGFSTAGKRKVTDDRNNLFKEQIRLIEGLQPKVFVIENVSGMIKGTMKGLFIEIMKTLKSLNYQVKCKLMNAKYYNVPQSRERVIFIGVRNDLGIEPSYPKPCKKLITPRMAFIDCSKDEIKLLPKWLKEAAKYIDAGNYNHKSVLKAFLKIKGSSGGSQNTKLLAWDRVSCTLTKSEIAFTGIIHPNRERYLTIAEMKKLSSFPDDFKFIGDRKDKVARIGNSVPPKFMQAIAENIRDNILMLSELK